MKRRYCALAILSFSLLSNISYANWWNGWNNLDSNNQTNGSIQGLSTGSGNTRSTSQGSVQGWTSNTGNADSQVDFSVDFKGKGRTDLNAAGNLGANSQAATKATGSWINQANTVGNFLRRGYGTNSSSNKITMPWNGINMNGLNQKPANPPMNWPPMKPTAFMPPQAPNFQQMQAQMEIQRKQFEAYVKQMTAQQEVAKQAYKNQLKAPVPPNNAWK